MSASKFFIYGGGRWREVDETGRIAGWAGSRFVYVKRGKLCVASRRAVLRGLKDLTIGKPGSVKVGLPLSVVKTEDLNGRRALQSNKESKICHCCNHKNGSCHDIDANFNKLLKPSTNTIAVQCNPTKDIGTQVFFAQSQNYLGKQRENILQESVASTRRNENEIREERSREGHQNSCRELLIDENVIELFRRFILNDRNNIFNVDLLKFDEDDDYKKFVFYKINPLVSVERDRRIQSILDANDDVARKRFAEGLGLLSVNDPMLYRKFSKRRRLHGNKENLHSETGTIGSVKLNDIEKLSTNKSASTSDRHVRNSASRKDREVSASIKNGSVDTGVKSNLPRSKLSMEAGSKVRNSGKNAKSVNKISAGSGSTLGKVKKIVEKLTANTSKSARDYSKSEDEAIVAWLLKHEQGSYVNGNRIWRMLQPIHHSSTGQFRSWHSLRNRYLRYILPSLDSLGLPQPQVTALRAAASAGEIKTRKVPRRNSIFNKAPVRSAWGAKHRPQQQNEEEPETSKPLQPKTTSPAKNKLPTYSEITRRFAMRHRSTPVSESDQPKRKDTSKGDGDRQTDEQHRKVVNGDASIVISDDSDSPSEEMKNHRPRIRHSRLARDTVRSKLRVESSSGDEDEGKDKTRPSILPTRDKKTRSRFSPGEDTKNTLKYNGKDVSVYDFESDEEVSRRDDSNLRFKKSKRHTENSDEISRSNESGKNKDFKSVSSKRKSRNRISKTRDDQISNTQVDISSRKEPKVKYVDKVKSRNKGESSKMVENRRSRYNGDGSKKPRKRSQSRYRKDGSDVEIDHRQQRRSIRLGNLKADDSKRNGEYDDRGVSPKEIRNDHVELARAKRKEESEERKNRKVKRRSDDRSTRKSPKLSTWEIVHSTVSNDAVQENTPNDTDNEEKLRKIKKKHRTKHAEGQERRDKERKSISTVENQSKRRGSKETSRHSRYEYAGRSGVPDREVDETTRSTKRRAESVDRHAKKPRITYESSDDDRPGHTLNRKNISSSSSSSGFRVNKSRSNVRLQFEDESSGSSFNDMSSTDRARSERRTRLSTVRAADGSDRQKRTRRLFNPKVPV